MPAPLRQPANAGVIAWLEQHGGEDDDRAPAPERDYLAAGHPDIVERVWDQLGKPLPMEARRVIFGRAALVHPETRIIVALAIGTQYALRLPARVPATVRDTLRTATTWSNGRRLSVRDAFGPDWIFGDFARA